MKTSEVLLAARELIATPERWTQGQYARAADGMWPSTVDSCEAICWCPIGAVDYCAIAVGTLAAMQATDMARTFLGRAVGGQNGLTFIDWNDAPERTHAEVIEALTKAAALAAAEEQS